MRTTPDRIIGISDTRYRVPVDEGSHQRAMEPAHGTDRLPDSALRVLQALWERAARGGADVVSRDDVVEAARAASATAHASGLLAEHLICEVKESWRVFPGFSTAALRHDARLLLVEMVTECIVAYYDSVMPAAEGVADVPPSVHVERPPAAEQERELRATG